MIESDALVNKDSLKAVEEIPNNSVDMLITDPPYNISTDFEMGRSNDSNAKYSGTDRVHDFGDWDQGDVTVEDWLPLFKRCLKDNAVVLVMYDYFRLTDIVETMEDLGWEPRQPIIWHKTNPMPQGHAVKWQDAVEAGIIGTVNEGQGHNYQKEQGQRHNVIESSLCMGEERYEDPHHPTQKPEELFEPIFKWWSERGDTILDPFMGTGTIPAVADRMGRHYIGIEKSEDFYGVAEERIESQTSGDKSPEAETGAVQSVFDW